MELKYVTGKEFDKSQKASNRTKMELKFENGDLKKGDATDFQPHQNGIEMRESKSHNFRW